MREKQRHRRTGIDVIVERYLTFLDRADYSPQSRRTYRAGVVPFLAFLRTRGLERLQDVTQQHVMDYRAHLADRALGDATIDVYLLSARRLFGFLEQSRQILLNPFEGQPPRRRSRRLQPVPSEAAVARLLEQPDPDTACGLRDRALLEVAYSTGVRLGELVGMDLPDLDLAAGTVIVRGKGARDRVVPLGRRAGGWVGQYLAKGRPCLRKQDDAGGAVWLGACGRRFSPRLVQVAIRGYVAQAGLAVRVTPHALRRACATHMLAHGAHPAQIQALLGHASAQHLSQYLQVTLADLMKTHANGRPGR